jgi:hypothetical protein
MPSTTPPSIEDEYTNDDENTPIAGEQQPAIDPPAEPEPVIPTPGEQQTATYQLPPTNMNMRRAAQLLKDLAAAKLRMETEPRGRAKNRRVEAARLAHETTSPEQPTYQSEPILPSAAVAIAEPTSYKRAMAEQECTEWTLATKQEIDCHTRNGTWELISR